MTRVPTYKFGSNRKQVGSNVGSTEFHFGRCPTGCEQCYVNFGNNRHAWARMSDAYRRYGKKHGWDGSPYLMPRRPDPAWSCRISTVELMDGRDYPYFLRVGTLGDPAYAPTEWVQLIRSVWGEAAFFNTSIRTVLPPELGGTGATANLGEYHKLVVTTNPGFQRPRPPTRDRRTHEQNSLLTVGSMGDRAPADFFDPVTLAAVGLPAMESVVKFYRVRCLSTVWPHLETDAPVVMTPLRFYAVVALLEFARKYDLAVEVETQSRVIAADCELYGVTPNVRPGRTLVRVYDDTPRNASDHRGEPTHFAWAGSYLVPDKKPLATQPWVCGRRDGSCKSCGLCASLDGMFPDAVNPYNPIPPVPFSDTYLDTPWKEDWKMHANPDALDGDGLFRDMLQDVWHGNPGAPAAHEEDAAWLGMALSQVGRYYSFDSLGDHMDIGWGTDGDVETLLAYCYWLLCRKAVRESGYPPPRIKEIVEDHIAQGTGIPHVLDGIDDLELLWTNEGKWVDVFGSVYPEDATWNP
jgi:hypothetical protein